jgi:hypothetical protein
MTRYIDADALGIGKADRNAFNFPEYADGWNTAIQIIEEAPTADVVPRAEVERLQHILDSYAIQYGTVKDQREVMDRIKQETAMEIFEEIEKFNRKPLPECKPVYIIKERELAKLKKKYTEGNQNG